MCKIVWSQLKIIEFSIVDVGTVFEWEGQVYLKVASQGIAYNAFSFMDNCLVIFNETDTVEVLECELHLTRQTEK